MKRKLATIASVLTISALALTGCSAGQSEIQQRKESQKSTTLKDSLELKNLERKRQKENDPSAERYIYLMNYGQIVGYYVAIGKISSSGSQLAPEQDLIRAYSGGEYYAVDSAKDDGSFGPGDPGIFFFTSDEVMVETSLDYIVSDSPLAIDVPRLEK